MRTPCSIFKPPVKSLGKSGLTFFKKSRASPCLRSPPEPVIFPERSRVYPIFTVEKGTKVVGLTLETELAEDRVI
jgi:hypothetical protein